jgi:eukaryotic-like serine/threonine-protein kinase
MPSPSADESVDRPTLEELFHAAAELSDEDRDAFLATRCGDDAALRDAVLRLLRADGMTRPLPAETALQLEAMDSVAMVDVTAGRSFGSYRATERIGVGGMGIVYKAVRDDDEYRKTVAVKILPLGFETQERVERFRRERQILATLDHPNIARLLDGGTTGDGLPYLVMEYVEGLPLDRFAAERGLGLEDRLRLFVQVCGGVQFAHRNLVVHCDLKPSNVVVTADGVPKLLDFGIAKLLDDARRESTATAPLMTPEYASPEQLLGQPITTASDVYSLGALLDVLLGGKRRATGEAVPACGPKLRDVRSIIEMATRTEPDRRYSTAEDLAADIRRHLDRRPVTARRGSLAYRSGRFLRRNRAVVSLAIVALLALGAATRSSWSHARRAERRFNDLHRLASFLLFDTYDGILRLPGSTELRRSVVAQSKAYLDSLASESLDDLPLTRDLIEAYIRLGNLQGYDGAANLGDTAGALESYGKAERLLDASSGIWKDSGRRIEYGVLSSYKYRVLLRAGRVGEAIEEGRRFVRIAVEIRKERPASKQARYFEANARYALAKSMLQEARDNRSVTEATAAVAALEAVAGPLTDPAGFSHDLARNALLSRTSAWSNLAGAHLDIGDRTGDAAHYETALDFSNQIVAALTEWLSEEPNRADVRVDVAEAKLMKGRSLAKLGRLQPAFACFREALAVFEGLAAADPANVEAQQGVADARLKYALALFAADDRRAARESGLKAAAIYREVVGHDGANEEARRALREAERLIQ